jgi:hypothetical protein
MSNTIQIKRSSTSGSAPTAGQLAQGELAVNLADEALYTKDASNAVVKLNAPSIDDKNTGSTKHVTIASGGNVGIGTSSPAVKLQVKTQTNANAGFLNSTSVAGGVKISCFNDAGNASSPFEIDGSTLQFNIASVERARIDSSGSLLVNTTASGEGVFVIRQRTGERIARFDTVDAGTIEAIQFVKTSGGAGQVGSITMTTTATAYNTSSDYRLKHDIQPLQNALATVAQLKPVTYKWNADDSESQGFIAHELQEVVPECVTGEKDAVDAEGNPKYQGIDTSFLVATLVSAIQELKAELDTVKAEVIALKAKE